MKTKLLWCVLTLALALATSASAQSPAGFQPLFNGHDLAGWQVPAPNPFWKVVDGVLVGENDAKLKGNVLHTEKSYTNFVLELEVRWSGEIDSGVMLRRPELQVQFGVSRSLKRDMTGSFYVSKTSFQPKSGYPEPARARNIQKWFKPDDWNRFKIEAKGDTFTVWLNGEKVSQYQNANYAGGAPIGVQIHPGLKMKVEFRNVRIQSLD